MAKTRPWALPVVALALAFVGACVEEIDPRSALFPCETHADCAVGYLCDPVAGVCLPQGSGDAVAPDVADDGGDAAAETDGPPDGVDGQDTGTADTADAGDAGDAADAGEGEDADDGGPDGGDAEIGGDGDADSPDADGDADVIVIACDPGQVGSCDDGNPCTDERCDPVAGCVYTDNAASCDDGTPCTTEDRCSAGVCAGTPMDCDDHNGCTDDICNPKTLKCLHLSKPPCTDGDLCTTDSCDPSTGDCVFAPVQCDDGDPCNGKESCLPATGSCSAGVSVKCPKDQVCDAATGACKPDIIVCTPDCSGPGGGALRECGDDGCGGSCGGCSGDKTCSAAGKCEAPPPLEPGALDGGTMFTSLTFGATSCCADLTGDKKKDNALRGFMDLVLTPNIYGGSGPDVTMAAAIQAGELIAVLDAFGLDSVEADPVVELRSYRGVDTDGDFSGNLAGTGSVLVLAADVDAQTGEALHKLPASIAGSALTAGPGELVISLPLLGVFADVVLHQVSLKGTVAAGTNGAGVDITAGTLGGAIAVADVAAALNLGFAACKCWGLGGAPAVMTPTPGSLVCTAAATTAKPACLVPVDGEICTNLAIFRSSVCASLKALTPDVDIDGDAFKDAVSVGLMFSTKSTDIAGVQPVCQPNCGGVTCGDDGCGGTCGVCGDGTTCEVGSCVPVCTADCSLADCGDDGCGGSCGDCELGESCDAGVCGPACTADCGGFLCGDDGCGGSCGACPDGSTCAVDQMACQAPCAGGGVVDIDAICDGTADCDDGSDESACAPCGAGGGLILASALCDGEPDCADGSDEGAACLPCVGGGLYHVSGFCDGTPDCADGTDEASCGFGCADGGQVSLSAVCDGQGDCADGSDELGCFVCDGGATVLPPIDVCDGFAACADGADESACFVCDTDFVLPPSAVCDGSGDCLDGTDEVGCSCTPDCSGADPGSPRECGDDGCGGSCGACKPGQTCDGAGLCAGDVDCCSGNDCCAEHVAGGCQNEATTVCVCALDEFCCTMAWDASCANIAGHQCANACACDPGCDAPLTCGANGECGWACPGGGGTVALAVICDGSPDCPAGEDEASCWQCEDGSHGVPAALLCNGTAECPDFTDESYCADCLSGGGTAHLSLVCDGIDHCADKSDEAVCSCDGGATLLDGFDLCNGVADCADGFDESICD